MKKIALTFLFCLAKAFAVPLSVSQQIDTFAVAHNITPALLPLHHVCTSSASVFTTAGCGVDSGGAIDTTFVLGSIHDTALAQGWSNDGTGRTLTLVRTLTGVRANFSGNLGVGLAVNPAEAAVFTQDSNKLVSSRTRNNSSGAAAGACDIINAFGNSWGWCIGSMAKDTNTLSLYLDAGAGNSNQLRLKITTAGKMTLPDSLVAAGVRAGILRVSGASYLDGDVNLGANLVLGSGGIIRTNAINNVANDATMLDRISGGTTVGNSNPITITDAGKLIVPDTSILTHGARFPNLAHSAGQDSVLAITTAGQVHTMPFSQGVSQGYVDSAFEDGRNASFTDLSASTVTANDFYSATLSNVDAVAAWYADVGSKPRLGSILKSPGDTLATTAGVFLLGKMHWDSTWQAFTDYHLGDAVAAPTGSDPTVEGYTFVCGQFTCAGASGLDAAVGFSKLGVTGEDTSVTVTLSGCTVSTTGTASISRAGHNINLTIPALSCTSNSSTAIISGIPAKYWPALVSTSGLLNVTNNSVSGLGYAEFETNGDIVLSNTLVSLITGGISTPSSSFTNGQDKGVQSFSMSAVR